MKKLIPLLISLILIFSAIVTVSAHPGSLDENGGHYNRKTGEYHYHDGDHTESTGSKEPYAPEEQYPFYVTEDDFESVYGENESNGNLHNFTEDSVEYDFPSDETYSVFTFIFGLFFVWFMAYSILMCIRFFASFSYKSEIMDINQQLNFNHPHTKITATISLILATIFACELKIHSFFFFIVTCIPICLDKKEYKRTKTRIEAERKQKFEEEKQHYTEMYGGKDILEIINAPDTAFIDSDGEPHQSVNNDDIFVVYVAPKQPRVFHRNRGCGKNLIKKNYIDIDYYHNGRKKLSPCKKCKPAIPDTTWYDEYRKIKAIKEKYKIE